MRICIVGTSRSGTTSLLNYICHSLSLDGITEPFNNSLGERNITEYDIWKKPNTVVKHLIEQVPKDKLNILNNYYDKVILIFREDSKAAAQSWLAAEASLSWDRHYNYESIISNLNEEKVYRKLKEDITKRERLVALIKSLNYFTTTYEDLFLSGRDVKKIKDFLSITSVKYDYLLDSSRKLRKDNPIKKTLQ